MIRVEYRDYKYYIVGGEPHEIKMLEKSLSWFVRDGTLKDLKTGNWVRVKPNGRPKPMSYGQVVGIDGQNVEAEFLDGSRHTYFIYNLEPAARETLILGDDEGPYFYYGLLKLMKERGFEFEGREAEPNKIRYAEVPEGILDGVKLHMFQRMAVTKALQLQRGLLVIPTSGGKTEIMLATLRILLNEGKIQRALVLVPSTSLAGQFVERGKLRGFGDGEIGALYSGRKDYSANILAATIDSVRLALRNKDPQMVKFIQEMNALLVDESHHLRSDSASKIALGFMGKVEYLLGFSGSPFLFNDPLENPGDALIYGITGGPIFKIGYGHLKEIGLVSEPIIHFKTVGSKAVSSRQHYNKIYEQYIVKHPDRNKAIETYTRRFVKAGLQTLILVQRLEHAEILMKLLSDCEPLAVFGGGVGVYYSDLGERVQFEVNYDRIREQIAEGRWNIVIGSAVMEEGFDAPSIGAVIHAAGGKSRIKNLQKLGRGLRKKKHGPNVVYVLEFMDRTHVFLQAHSRVRKKLFEEVGAVLIEDEFQFNNAFQGHRAKLRQMLGQAPIQDGGD